MSRRLAAGLLGAPVAGFAAVALFAAVAGTGAATQSAATSCGASAPAVTVAGVPVGAVAGYSGNQLAAAAAIMRAGVDAGADVRGQTIAVAVAMGESGLHPLGYGDAAGPDSRGYFQQRDLWGPLAVRVDAYGSARLFFTGGQGGQRGLLAVPGWQGMTPTHAAHAVQANADPEYYAQFWSAAVAVVSALAGVHVDLGPGGGQQTCAIDPGAVPAGPGGWNSPTHGSLSSGFSARINPVTGAVEHHNGQDIAAPCGTPIYAAAAGTITRAGPATGFGDAIYEDAGGGVVLIYGHEYPSGLEVVVGQPVTAGQEIGKVGSNGQSTGCHDHFQVNVNGAPVDPVPFMAARGVTLGR